MTIERRSSLGWNKGNTVVLIDDERVPDAGDMDLGELRQGQRAGQLEDLNVQRAPCRELLGRMQVVDVHRGQDPPLGGRRLAFDPPHRTMRTSSKAGASRRRLAGWACRARRSARR
jgi:hypothetical protein